MKSLPPIECFVASPLYWIREITGVCGCAAFPLTQPPRSLVKDKRAKDEHSQAAIQLYNRSDKIDSYVCPELPLHSC
jgi:hypothetical protein